ncbi:hypothetical protein, partial [Enterocloster citroniae]|uniref:hypothetical protein n=1 Tax=Enterocloster citroniae TaxID=358743 RepID=UPI00349ECC1A
RGSLNSVSQIEIWVKQKYKQNGNINKTEISTKRKYERYRKQRRDGDPGAVLDAVLNLARTA